MQYLRYIVLDLGFLLWGLPFLIFRTHHKCEKPQKLDRRARFGIILQTIGYVLLWQSKFWEMQVPKWRLGLSILFFALAALFSWPARRALGKQWRFDAGLNSDHVLVRNGPYRFVRHPIYSSMLCVFLGAGFNVTPLPLFTVALALFLIGTEIRVRIEDGLLESRFGGDFSAYRRTVSAYIPFVK